MRQSLSETRERQESTTARRPALLVFGVAAALSLVLAVVAVADQVGPRSLMDHAEALYGPYDKTPTAGMQYGLLYGIALVNLVVWVGASFVGRGGTRWRRAVAIGGAALVTVAMAATLLAAREYGGQIFPVQWGLLALLPLVPAVFGLVRLRGGAR